MEAKEQTVESVICAFLAGQEPQIMDLVVFLHVFDIAATMIGLSLESADWTRRH